MPSSSVTRLFIVLPSDIYFPQAYTPSLSNLTISFPFASRTFAIPLVLLSPPSVSVPPLIRSASIVPATIKSAINPLPVPNVLQSQSLPSSVLLDAISNPNVPRHIAPYVADSGSKSSNSMALTDCFFATVDCAFICAFTPLMIPCTCCPISVPSSLIACSTRFITEDTSSRKLYWNSPSVTDLILSLTASHSSSIARASDVISSL